MNFEGKRLESWCYHLCYLDDKSLAVICYGNNNALNQDNLNCSAKTKLLGQPLNFTTDIFRQVKFKDFQNNKWLLS